MRMNKFQSKLKGLRIKFCIFRIFYDRINKIVV